MKIFQIISLLTIALFVGCHINNEDLKPEFIEGLYQRDQLPDSVGLEAQIEIRKTHNDSITVEFFITNKKDTDTVIIHSGNFASVAIYKSSKLIYPNVDPNKMVYFDDYNESVIPAQNQIQVWELKIHLPEPKGAKAVGFTHFNLKPENITGFSENSVVNSQEYWLVTPPKPIE